ncbi:sulfite exporter TauE/SafE family protein [Muricauda sp. SCSIO 64092]|uniref:sulfite exporter TauE/SafE family protein n=1 Tax=Allomuricauda sp. SCSIO 64092 TaxID=2908842 RepID=UPI001FF43390|nr:sulfite exporter TauE/SafE family protein [Muricauda sp. SCSIO 64092]UOY06629.1 sulfite exporter TauE/SafE family protein [Muricauda sp. SCSIO 64092]
MSLEWGEFILLVLAFFCIALLYSSVGFGGGSSYLAILALSITPFFVIRSTALVCNLVVVSGSCFLFYRAGHLKFKKFLPFILTSIPLAFIGAVFRLEEHIFFILLGIALILAALSLIFQTLNLQSNYQPSKYPLWFSYGIGGGVGLLSGLVGIGGGIFLAPILNYMKWDKPLNIAALASFFILVNSISGITGLVTSGTFEVFWPELLGLILAVFIGGQLGVRMTLVKISPKGIRILTAVLVFLVGVRVLIGNGLQIHLFS